jgi:hypothetical protein
MVPHLAVCLLVPTDAMPRRNDGDRQKTMLIAEQQEDCMSVTTSKFWLRSISVAAIAFAAIG